MVFDPWKNPSVKLDHPDASAQFSPWYQTSFNQGNLGKPYYNPFGTLQGDSPYAKAPEEVEPEVAAQQVVAEAAREVPDNGDREERARAIHTKAVQKAREKWGPNAPPLKLPGLIGAAIEFLGLGKPKEGWVEGNELSDGYYERNPGLPGSPLPGVSISEYRKMRDLLGVDPTGRPGRGHGDFDISTGGIYDEFGVARNEDGSIARTANGSPSFASWQDWIAALQSPGHGLKDARYTGVNPYTGAITDYGRADQGAITSAHEANLIAARAGDNPYRDESDSQHAGRTQHAINEISNQSGGWESASDAQLEAAYGGVDDWNFNNGGAVMNPLVSYRQAGGGLSQADLMNAEVGGVPAAQMGGEAPGAPGMPPGAPVAPVQAPQAPMAPAGPPPRKSFAEKVAEARAAIKAERTSVPTEMPMMASEPMMDPMMAPADGQGDVGILDPEGVFAPSAEMVGPDMGLDTIDGELPEGSFVMNEEGTDLFGDELKALCQGGYV